MQECEKIESSSSEERAQERLPGKAHETAQEKAKVNKKSCPTALKPMRESEHQTLRVDTRANADAQCRRLTEPSPLLRTTDAPSADAFSKIQLKICESQSRSNTNQTSGSHGSSASSSSSINSSNDYEKLNQKLQIEDYSPEPHTPAKKKPKMPFLEINYIKTGVSKTSKAEMLS